jgi:hypothetical protein
LKVQQATDDYEPILTFDGSHNLLDTLYPFRVRLEPHAGNLAPSLPQFAAPLITPLAIERLELGHCEAMMLEHP